MKFKWEDIQKIAERNAVYLDEVPEAFLNKDLKLTEEELLLLLLLLLDDFETENGRIKKNRKNFFLVNKVDQLFRSFAVGGGLVAMNKLINKFQQVLANNSSYYYNMLGKSEAFTRVNGTITGLVNRRIGLEADGSVKPGGYISDLSNMTTVRNEVREMIYKNVLTEAKVSEAKTVLRNFIIGEEDKNGIVYKFYSKFAYDTFSQIDRMASSEFANEFGLTKFIYAGTIIATSRAFCRKKINGIYTIPEGMKWPYESPAPIGISIATYNPVLDLGGTNCRHTPLFITDSIAEDLKEKGFSGFNG